jgi:hypothetical protein
LHIKRINGFSNETTKFMKKFLTLKSTSITLIFIFFTIYSINLFADASGRTNRTKKTSTAGCNCHSSSSAITSTISGPTTVIAGQTYILTLTINMSSGSGGYGVDIAAKRGSLAVISGSGLKSVGELTHSSPISYSNPKVIQFNYTAPSTAGTDTIYANVDRGYSGAWAYAPNYGFTVETASGVINNETPLAFGLYQNFPNPFNPVTRISYSIEKAESVSLKVFDIRGNEVSSLVNSNQTAGSYSVEFDGKNLASGIYFYKLESEGRTEVKKMTLLK